MYDQNKCVHYYFTYNLNRIICTLVLAELYIIYKEGRYTGNGTQLLYRWSKTYTSPVMPTRIIVYAITSRLHAVN